MENSLGPHSIGTNNERLMQCLSEPLPWTPEVLLYSSNWSQLLHFVLGLLSVHYSEPLLIRPQMRCSHPYLQLAIEQWFGSMGWPISYFLGKSRNQWWIMYFSKILKNIGKPQCHPLWSHCIITTLEFEACVQFQHMPTDHCWGGRHAAYMRADIIARWLSGCSMQTQFLIG